MVSAPAGRQRNIIAAIVLSAIVLVDWQYSAAAERPASTVSLSIRNTGIATALRVKINAPRVSGSIALKGARIDDLALVQFRDTVDPVSPPTLMFSPSGTKSPYYAEFGWLAANGSTMKMPDANTQWQQEGSGSLAPDSPVTLKYDNGDGLTFRRTISIDDRYLFTVKDDVTNIGNAPVTLYPFALISRHGTPKVAGHYILHEGLIGYLGDQGLQEYRYKTIDDTTVVSFKVTNAWLGITDRYWASALLPDPSAPLQARFSSNLLGATRFYQTDYLLAPQSIAIGGTGTTSARLFVGPKEAGVVGISFPLASGLGGYNEALNLNHFDLLIDWGWFYFITKPMFLALDFFSRLVGNFGVAILILTAIVKVAFVPFANQSYRSMIKMRHLQPQVTALRERTDDREQADRAILELYKHENVTSPSGCLPIVIQVLIFFCLTKILNVTIDAHAPFFGWIHDLAAPDPSNVFNLFGLVPFDPTTVPLVGQELQIGAWPVMLGLTVWQLQRRIGPIQFGWLRRFVYATMPILVAYSFARYAAAGLVISLAFYNFLSIVHQSLLMKETEGTIGDISKYSAEVLPYGKVQPVIFLMLLAPALQNVPVFLVFWRRSKGPKTKIDP
jgi:YidC/Oxa1 family membrane protein insertase